MLMKFNVIDRYCLNMCICMYVLYLFRDNYENKVCGRDVFLIMFRC